MRFALLMSVAVCSLCLLLNNAIQRSRFGEDGAAVCSQPAITQDEIEAASAARVERIRSGGWTYGIPRDAIAVVAADF
jgi:hypothetical protein